MKLVAKERLEQGTPNGVMKFDAGAQYPLKKDADGNYLVAHEPRTVMQRSDERDKDGKVIRKPVSVRQTQVSKEIFDKLLASKLVVVEE